MPEFIQRVAASGRSSVNVWGAITLTGLGPLVRIENRFTADMYCSVLDDVMLPYLLNGPFTDGNFILQHDNFPIHKSRKVGALLQCHQVQLLEWPVQSPDLNIIENVWSTMKVSRRKLHGLSADALWAAVEEWEQVRANPGLCESLYYSLPGRMRAVIDAAGEATRY